MQLKSKKPSQSMIKRAFLVVRLGTNMCKIATENQLVGICFLSMPPKMPPFIILQYSLLMNLLFTKIKIKTV